MTHRRRLLELRGLIALVAALVVLAGVLAVSASGAPAPVVRPAGLAPQLPAGAVRLGAVDASQPVTFDVALAPSHPDELTALLHDLYDPSSPRYQHFLAPGAFAREFGPSLATVDAVVGWLHSAGFTDAQVVDGDVEVHAAAGEVGRGLGVSLSRYRAGGTELVSAAQAPLVPAALAGDITAVVGLSDASWHSQAKVLAPLRGSTGFASSRAVTSCSTKIEQQANQLGGWSTRQTGKRYQVPMLLSTGLNGAGKTIALYELAPHKQSDVAAFEKCFGLRGPVTTKNVDGGAPADDSGGTVEANLDIESAAVTAPGAKLVSYEGPNSQAGALHVWSAIVDDDTAQVISTSWGLCEALDPASDRNAMHTLFEQAAVQGQTIFAASGDEGSEGCLLETGKDMLSVDSPADDPLVTGVGGTSLMPKTVPTAPFVEPVWNDCQGAGSSECSFEGGAGGGGKSAVFKRPTWQPGNACATCRGVPDISANAGIGEAFEISGHWSLIGGTSIAAPHLAGIATDILGGCTTKLGQFNPKLYALAKLGGSGFAVRDVGQGQGDNDLTATNGGKYPALDGYDLATGLGTPLSGGLVCPEVAQVQPATAAAGKRVTIGGLGLQHAQIMFGKHAAQVVGTSGTSVTVVVPAGSGTVQVSASDAMGHGRHHVAFDYGG